MASPSATEFKQLFPQFSATADVDVERWLTQAALRFTASRFHGQWSMAAYCFTAHSLTLWNPDSPDNSADHQSRGAITSDKVLDQSRSYGVTFDMARVPSSLMEFTSTTYGLRLIGIMLSRSASRARVVRTGSSRTAT